MNWFIENHDEYLRKQNYFKTPPLSSPGSTGRRETPVEPELIPLNQPEEGVFRQAALPPVSRPR